MLRISADRVRRGLVIVSAIILLAALGTACIGSDDDDDGGVVPIMSTFTPVPPDFTPEAVQTRAAQATQFAQTATAQPATTPTIPPATSGSPASGTPQGTARPGEIRPPDAVLRTPGGDANGAIGNSNFVDPVTQTGASIEAPYVPLPAEAIAWPSGATGSIEVPNSPYAVRSALVELYSFDENVAKPQNPDGTPTGQLAFLPRTAPAQQAQINGASIRVTANVPPGNYIVAARIVWEAPSVIVNEKGEQEQFTQYVFVVRVE